MVALAQAFVELRVDRDASSLERDVTAAATRAGDKGSSVLHRLLGNVRPSFTGLTPAAERAGGEAGAKAATRFSRSFAERASHSFQAGLFAGLGYQALRGIEGVFKAGFAEAKDSAAASALAANSIKSMGVESRITKPFLDDIATSLSNISGIDDDDITRMEALLATFQHIDTSRPIFKRAAADVVDFARQFTDGNLQTAVVQVGKALDDPVQGMSALHRVGVSFTADQEALIKKLEESGHGLAAQQEIFKALEPQIKGAAAAYGNTLPGQIDKAMVSIHNLEGEVVSALAPAAAQLLGPLVASLKAHAPEIQHDATVVAAALLTLGHDIGVVVGFVVAHKDVFLPLAGGVAALWVAFKGYKIIHDVQLALEGLSHVGVVGLLITLAGAFVTAYETSATFRNGVNTAFRDVEHIIGLGVAGIVLSLKHIADVWFTVVGAIVDGGAKAFGWVPGIGGKLKDAAKQFDTLRSNVDSALGGIADDAAGFGAAAGGNFGQGFAYALRWASSEAMKGLTAAAGKNGVGVASFKGGSRSPDFDTQTNISKHATAAAIKPIGDGTTGADFGSAAPASSGGSTAAAKAATDWAGKFTSAFATAVKQGAPAVRLASKHLQQEVLKGLADDPAQRQKVLELLAKDTTKAINTAEGIARAKAKTLGATITAQLRDAIDTGSDKVTSVLQALMAKVTSTLDGVGQGATRDRLLDYLKARAAGLKGLADQVTGLKAQIVAANDTISALTSEAQGFQSALAATLKQGADLGAAWMSGQGLESSLGNQLTLLTAFGDTLDKLKAAGLSDDALKQIGGLGPQQGQQVGLGILAAGDATKVGGLVDQINSLADAIASKETTEIYSPQLDAANANLVTLQTLITSLEKTVAGLAKPIGTSTAQALTGVGGSSVSKSKAPVPRKRASIK